MDPGQETPLNPVAHYRIVIVGAGIAGAAIAYHLAQLGERDVAVLDQGDLAGGTTAHAPGLVGQLRTSVSLTKMLMSSVSLYRTLRVAGMAGFDEVGSLRLASSPERMVEVQRQAGFALGVGLEAHVLSPPETKELFPFMSMESVVGALYLPSDGSARAPILTQAMITAAQAGGVSFFPHTRVEGIETSDGAVGAVLTSAGRIKTDILVIASGIWSSVLARTHLGPDSPAAGVTLPLMPMQHQYVVAGPYAGLEEHQVPNLRDPDRLVYYRQEGASFVVGGYERTPIPWGTRALPTGADPTVLSFDTDHFDPLWQSAVTRVPVLAALPRIRQINGLEAFTPDGEFLLGPVPGMRGLWAACGFCAHGVSGAGGVGKVMAEWIVGGEPSLDLWHMDLRRFGAYSAAQRYMTERSSEVYRTYYDISYPGRERSSSRNLRLSPLYAQLKALGAVFGEKAGWERPNWFAGNETPVDYMPRGWPARDWSPAIAAEHLATRERAALFDETSFSKIELLGPGALAALQVLAANEMDRPIGTVTYTQLLNERGGIECDLTVTRVAADRFMMITGTAFGGHDLNWIEQHLPRDGSVYAHDVSGSRCCIGLWGPRARDIVQSVCDDDLSDSAFPYLTARSITVGEIPVYALRVTYVGELGWEIYASTEYGSALWSVLQHAGAEFGALAAGYRAIDSLRLEKGYRYWSADIHSEYTPLEAGLGFAIRLDKGEFIGRNALLAQRAEGITRRLCCLVTADPTALVLGGEPILHGQSVIGRVTSGGYGYSVRQSIAYGYLPMAHARPGTMVDIMWFGERIPATVMREPLYDPKNLRIKGAGPRTTTSA